MGLMEYWMVGMLDHWVWRSLTVFIFFSYAKITFHSFQWLEKCERKVPNLGKSFTTDGSAVPRMERALERGESRIMFSHREFEGKREGQKTAIINRE